MNLHPHLQHFRLGFELFLKVIEQNAITSKLAIYLGMSLYIV